MSGHEPLRPPRSGVQLSWGDLFRLLGPYALKIPACFRVTNGLNYGCCNDRKVIQRACNEVFGCIPHGRGAYL